MSRFPRVVNLRVTEQTWRELEAVAEAEQTSVSAVARRLILRGLAGGGGPGGPGGPAPADGGVTGH